MLTKLFKGNILVIMMKSNVKKGIISLKIKGGSSLLL